MVIEETQSYELVIVIVGILELLVVRVVAVVIIVMTVVVIIKIYFWSRFLIMFQYTNGKISSSSHS